MRMADFFERIYVVNLPERTDRRRAITQELDRAGMPLTPGKVEIFPAIRPTETLEFPSIGARGCFLSHLSILKQAKQDGLANVLILEDDLAISPAFFQLQITLVKQLREASWDFVFLGHTQDSVQPAENVLQHWTKPLLTTHFYGVNGRTIDRLVDFLEVLQQRPAGHPDGGPMHLDGGYNTFRAQNPDTTTLIAVPILGEQRGSRSDITLSWRDRTPVVRQVASLVRLSKIWLRELKLT